ncbi:hypothetical protein D9613_008422 [Agrocybe pediades]|uniref:Uncharacterized protein n=1 Tax=Agrocybe pediades TaxID=84607 RepID=A0A8H4QSX4_9AGAR|nr:hypothetical protein D9613_008422 [Agrocybe pediades]
MSARLDHSAGRASAQPRPPSRAMAGQYSMDIEPDLEWKTRLQAQIRGELHVLVQEAQSAYEAAKARALQEYNDTILRIGEMEQQRYDAGVEAERRRRAQAVAARPPSRPASTVHPLGIPRLSSTAALAERRPSLASSPNPPSPLIIEAAFEPSESWKQQARANIHLSLQELKNENIARYKEDIEKADPAHRQQLLQQCDAENERIAKEAEGQYIAALNLERKRRKTKAMQSRMQSGTLNPAQTNGSSQPISTGRRVFVEDQLSDHEDSEESEESEESEDGVDRFIKDRFVEEQRLRREAEARLAATSSQKQPGSDDGSEDDGEEKIVLQFSMEFDKEKPNGNPPQTPSRNKGKGKEGKEVEASDPRQRRSKIVNEDDDANSIISLSDPALIEQQKYAFKQWEYAQREQAIKQRKRHDSIVQETSAMSSPSTQSSGSPSNSKFFHSRRPSDVSGQSRMSSTNTSPASAAYPASAFKTVQPSASPTHSRTSSSNAIPIARPRTGSISWLAESPTQYTAAEWKRRQSELTVNGTIDPALKSKLSKGEIDVIEASNRANNRARAGSIQQGQAIVSLPGTSPKSVSRSTSPAISRSASTMPTLNAYSANGGASNLFWRPTPPRSASTAPTHTPHRTQGATASAYSTRGAFN